jgi:hypothetical protein
VIWRARKGNKSGTARVAAVAIWMKRRDSGGGFGEERDGVRRGEIRMRDASVGAKIRIRASMGGMRLDWVNVTERKLRLSQGLAGEWGRENARDRPAAKSTPSQVQFLAPVCGPCVMRVGARKPAAGAARRPRAAKSGLRHVAPAVVRTPPTSASKFSSHCPHEHPVLTPLSAPCSMHGTAGDGSRDALDNRSSGHDQSAVHLMQHRTRGRSLFKKRR